MSLFCVLRTVFEGFAAKHLSCLGNVLPLSSASAGTASPMAPTAWLRCRQAQPTELPSSILGLPRGAQASPAANPASARSRDACATPGTESSSPKCCFCVSADNSEGSSGNSTAGECPGRGTRPVSMNIKRRILPSLVLYLPGKSSSPGYLHTAQLAEYWNEKCGLILDVPINKAQITNYYLFQPAACSLLLVFNRFWSRHGGFQRPNYLYDYSETYL